MSEPLYHVNTRKLIPFLISTSIPQSRHADIADHHHGQRERKAKSLRDGGRRARHSFAEEVS